jgi:hypothetical protein
MNCLMRRINSLLIANGFAVAVEWLPCSPAQGICGGLSRKLWNALMFSEQLLRRSHRL